MSRSAAHGLPSRPPSLTPVRWSGPGTWLPSGSTRRRPSAGPETAGKSTSPRIPGRPGKPGPGQSTVGIRTAGEANIANAEDVETAIDRKLSQHKGLADPLVVVLDLSAAVIDDFEVAAALYGPATTSGDRNKGTWAEPISQPPRPAAVLTLRGIWPSWQKATADLWLPPGASSPVLPGPWSFRTLGQDHQQVTTQAALQPAADYLK